MLLYYFHSLIKAIYTIRFCALFFKWGHAGLCILLIWSIWRHFIVVNLNVLDFRKAHAIVYSKSLRGFIFTFAFFAWITFENDMTCHSVLQQVCPVQYKCLLVESFDKSFRERKVFQLQWQASVFLHNVIKMYLICSKCNLYFILLDEYSLLVS